MALIKEAIPHAWEPSVRVTLDCGHMLLISKELAFDLGIAAGKEIDHVVVRCHACEEAYLKARREE